MENDDRKYPFDRVVVLFYQAWRKAIRSAKEGGPNEEFYCRQAALCQAQYICAHILKLSEIGEKKHD